MKFSIYTDASMRSSGVCCARDTPGLRTPELDHSSSNAWGKHEHINILEG